MSGPADNNMADAMETWYYGVGTDSFEAEFNPDGTTTGNDTHGSRVIWRASTQMGCAVSNCPGNDNNDSFSVMCHFGNGVSWNQVSKPGTCNPTETDVKVNLGKPLGHTSPLSNSAFSQGYTIPGTCPNCSTSAAQGSSATGTPSQPSTLSSVAVSASSSSTAAPIESAEATSSVVGPSTATSEKSPVQIDEKEQNDCEWE